MNRKEKTINVSVCIPRSWHKRLKRIARREACSISDVIRHQLKNFLFADIPKGITLGENTNTEDTDDE